MYSVKEKCGFVQIFQLLIFDDFFFFNADILHFQPGSTEHEYRTYDIAKRSYTATYRRIDFKLGTQAEKPLSNNFPNFNNDRATSLDFRGTVSKLMVHAVQYRVRQRDKKFNSQQKLMKLCFLLYSCYATTDTFLSGGWCVMLCLTLLKYNFLNNLINFYWYTRPRFCSSEM